MFIGLYESKRTKKQQTRKFGIAFINNRILNCWKEFESKSVLQNISHIRMTGPVPVLIPVPVLSGGTTVSLIAIRY